MNKDLRSTILAILVFFLLNPSVVFAQTPSNWQNNATGLKTVTNSNDQTAGLSTTVRVGNKANGGIPFLMIAGGVRDGGWSQTSTAVGIDLGQIKNPGVSSATLNTESADWAHDQMTFTTNLNNQVNVWVSRLSPAVLVQNATNSLRLFSGNLSGATMQPGQWPPYPLQVTNRTPAPSFPKYIAYSSGGTMVVQSIPAPGGSLPLPSLDNNWILVWYGNNSHFTDLKLPLGYALGGDWGVGMYSITEGYLADAPMLVKFQSNPTSMVQSSEGGIDLSFSGNSGYSSILPLFGREHPQASETESWAANKALPSNVLAKINFWNSNNRLCSYPTNVSETYAYDGSSDTATISENITYLNVCPGGSTNSGFATLPPAVALAKDALGANFGLSGTLTDAQYSTEFGPIMGIDNINNYSYSVSGLKKYTDSQRIITNPNGGPPDLVSELTAEVDKVTKDGHYAPWIFHSMFPESVGGELYFTNPADTILTLAEIIPILPEPQKTNLIGYLKSERANYPPETVYNISLTDGKVRDFYSVPPNLNIYGTPLYQWLAQNRPQIFLKKVPLYSFFALSRYYDVTGDTIPASVVTAAKNTLDTEMAERDWANFHYFKSFNQTHTAVNDTNRTLAGLIGYVKLMEATKDTTEGLGRALLAKTAIERIAMAKYPRYLYTANLVSLPPDPAWMAKDTANQAWQGFIANYNWTSGNDDPQQVVQLDQFGTSLYEHIGYYPPGQATCCDTTYYPYSSSPKLVGYLDLVPETFRLLSDFAKQDTQILFDKYTGIFPDWYATLMEQVLGNENDNTVPTDAYQLFMADIFLKGDTGQNLRRYRSIPWLDAGDFFYDVKLAETIKAYKGWQWGDQISGTPSPPTPIPTPAGDINSDGKIDGGDLFVLLQKYLTNDSVSDLNKDGIVNMIDGTILINNFAK